MFRTTVILSLGALLGAASAPFLSAQTELGVLGGYGFATSMTATASGTSAEAGFHPGAAVGGFFGMNQTDRIGGEIRYLLRWNNLRLSQGGTETTFTGRSHLIHYDFLVHARSRSSHIRPFLAGGAGIRLVEGTGAQQVYQPLSQFALLTQTREVLPLISAGGGIKFRLSSRLYLRTEIRDYISPPLGKVIAASPGATLHGWIHDVVPLAGLTFMID